jgi:hypothetical protein
MGDRRVVNAALALAVLLVSTTALAQAPLPSRPGPFIINMVGTMSGEPSGTAFHPDLPANTLVPKRGFGVGGGVHVYLFTLGPARIGIGFDASRQRATATTAPATTVTTTTSTGTTTSTSGTGTNVSPFTPEAPIGVATTITVFAPQVSFNFGTHDGWSYISGGYGAAQIHSEATGQLASPLTGTATFVRDEGRRGAINYGGGARWFLREHLAVGFDLRFHRLAAAGTQPSTRSFVLSAGVSVR